MKKILFREKRHSNFPPDHRERLKPSDLIDLKAKRLRLLYKSTMVGRNCYILRIGKSAGMKLATDIDERNSRCLRRSNF